MRMPSTPAAEVLHRRRVERGRELLERRALVGRASQAAHERLVLVDVGLDVDELLLGAELLGLRRGELAGEPRVLGLARRRARPAPRPARRGRRRAGRRPRPAPGRRPATAAVDSARSPRTSAIWASTFAFSWAGSSAWATGTRPTRRASAAAAGTARVRRMRRSPSTSPRSHVGGDAVQPAMRVVSSRRVEPRSAFASRPSIVSLRHQQSHCCHICHRSRTMRERTSHDRASGGRAVPAPGSPDQTRR